MAKWRYLTTPEMFSEIRQFMRRPNVQCPLSLFYDNIRRVCHFCHYFRHFAINFLAIFEVMAKKCIAIFIIFPQKSMAKWQ